MNYWKKTVVCFWKKALFLLPHATRQCVCVFRRLVNSAASISDTNCFRESIFFPGVITHIECQKHGNMKFCKLRSKIKTPLKNGGVNHIYDEVNTFFRQFLKNDSFFRRRTGKRIDSGQVDQLYFHIIQRE